MKSPRERRREPRRPAEGEIRIWIGADALRARLLDSSRHGFRIEHGRPDLCSGCEVRFQHASASGRARLIWNHIQAGKVESGFLVL
jgi:hypothetical protein